MTAPETLAAIRSAGGSASIAAGRLVVDAPQDFPEQLWRAVAEHRDELLELLAEPPAGPADLLREIRQAGGEVVLDGPRLSLHLPRGLADETLDRLARGRDELHRHLAETAWRDPFAAGGPLPQPAGADCCDRCGSRRTFETEIHGGASTRQDCADCGRLRRFTRWNGVEMP